MNPMTHVQAIRKLKSLLEIVRYPTGREEDLWPEYAEALEYAIGVLTLSATVPCVYRFAINDIRCKVCSGLPEDDCDRYTAVFVEREEAAP